MLSASPTGYAPAHLAETTMTDTSLRKFFTRPAALGALAAGVLLSLSAAIFAADEPALNVPPKGFVALFNGKDLAGWKGLVLNPRSRPTLTAEEWPERQKKADVRMNKHWHVVDGVLMFDGAAISPTADNICTAKDYGNFEMLVDWKIEKGGDSGVYLRGSPQVQIWDADEPSQVEARSGQDGFRAACGTTKRTNGFHWCAPTTRLENGTGSAFAWSATALVCGSTESWSRTTS